MAGGSHQSSASRRLNSASRLACRAPSHDRSGGGGRAVAAASAASNSCRVARRLCPQHAAWSLEVCCTQRRCAAPARSGAACSTRRPWLSVPSAIAHRSRRAGSLRGGGSRLSYRAGCCEVGLPLQRRGIGGQPAAHGGELVPGREEPGGLGAGGGQSKRERRGRADDRRVPPTHLHHQSPTDPLTTKTMHGRGLGR